MAVTNITGESGTPSLVDLLYEAREKASTLDSSSTLASSESLLSCARTRKAQNAYGGGSAASAIGQAALSRALSEMQSDGGKVTFSQIAGHREKLEIEFTANVRLDLAERGVSIDTEFSLSMSADGTINVLCDDAAARENILKYLEENPEVCEQFGYIQALSNLERARQSPAAGMAAWREVRNAKSELQTRAVEAFFDAAMNTGMDYSSLLANFGAGEKAEVSFYAGLNFRV